MSSCHAPLGHTAQACVPTPPKDRGSIMSMASRIRTVGGWTMGSRVLGLYRDRLLAGAFGASLLLDAFLVAFQLPNLLRQLFGEGALANAFIPRYVRLRQDNEAGAESFAGLVLTRLALLLALVSAVAMAVAAGLVLWGPPGAVPIARLAIPQLPFLLFVCVVAIAAGILQARGRFWVPAAAPVILNLCLITAVLAWRDIALLPYAVLAAGILQLALHLLALARSGGVPPLRLAATPALIDLRRAMGPTIISASAHQINVLADSLIAYLFITRLDPAAAGAVGVLYFGNRLLQFPMALIGHAVGAAIYPDLAQAASQGYAASADLLRRGTAVLARWLLPATVGLAVVAEPLTRTLLQTGTFDAASAERTILVTRILALGIMPFSLNLLLIRMFLAHLDQRLPMIIALIGVAVNLVLNLILVQTPLREAGLALASVLTGTGTCITFLLILQRRGSGPVVALATLLRPALAATVMGLGVLGLLHWWPLDREADTSAQALRLGAAVALGAAIYLLLLGRAGWRMLRTSGK